MTFTSAVLGEVQHPTNIIRSIWKSLEELKCIALILSWLDGWIQTKLRQGKPPWVYIVSQELALAFIAAIQFTDTSKNSVRGNTPQRTL